MKRLLRSVMRTAPGPLAVRGVVFFATAVALWLAMPAAMVSLRLLLPVFLLALLPALVPGGRVVAVAMFAVVGLWATSTLAFGEEAGVVRTFATACALYLAHSGAALAAMLPHDAIVDNQVIIRWAGRAVTVIVSSAAVAAVIVLLAPALTPTTSVLALLAGIGVAFALVALLAKAAGLRRQ